MPKLQANKCGLCKMEATPPLSPDVVELVIKNPARTSGEDFRLRVSLDNTIQQVKQLLQDEYEGNPEPSYQTVG